ncbi:hypothetical protein [Streptomyces avidinii]
MAAGGAPGGRLHEDVLQLDDPIDRAAAIQLRSLRPHHPLVFFNACRSAGDPRPRSRSPLEAVVARIVRPSARTTTAESYGWSRAATR